MKQMKLILSLTLTLFLQKAFCDIIPSNSHYVDKCVKITNIDEYDNLVMLGYIRSVGNYHESTYEISSAECLTKGYKFNTLRIFGVEKNKIAGKDISDIDLPNESYALETNIDIDPYSGYYNNSNPINKIEEYYKIIGFTDTSVIIHMWKEVYGFNNGSADSVINYNYSGDISKLHQDIPTELSDNKKSGTQIYQNEAKSILTIMSSNLYFGKVKVRLISLKGEVLFTDEKFKDLYLFTKEFSVANFQKGVYLLNLEFGNTIETKKIIIN